MKIMTGEGYIVPAFVTVDDLKIESPFAQYMRDLITAVTVTYVSIRKPKHSKYKGRKWNAMENLKFRCYVEKLRRGFGT